MKISTKTPPFYCQNPTLTDTLEGVEVTDKKDKNKKNNGNDQTFNSLTFPPISWENFSKFNGIVWVIFF